MGKDKKNKREYNRKLKAEGGPSSDAKEKPSSKKKDEKPQKASSNFSGVTESADKLITEANKRFEQAEQQPTVSDSDKKYAKRNIVSNWAKYEIPDDDEIEDDQETTGPDFEYVLSTAQGSEAHFKFKSEQEWVKETGNIGELSEEFFSLDLQNLESCIMKIPFHKQIELSEDEIEPEFLSRINTLYQNADLSVSSQEVEKEVSQKMLNILSFKDKDVQTTVPVNSSENEVKDGDTISDLKSTPTEILTEKGEKAETLKSSVVLNAAPLEQRQNRRQRGSKNIKKVEEKEVSESEDLKFIEDLGKAEVAEKTDDQRDDSNTVISNVVPVKINSTEKQNLEDWLDDFLDD